MPKGGLAELKDGSVPAGGESFLLMHARWKKLEQDIYHPRKGRYDISKVPDVYDAAKYDAIHNSHLLLTDWRSSTASQNDSPRASCPTSTARTRTVS